MKRFLLQNKCNFDEWQRQVDYFTFCYNISKSTHFNFKYSPYELVFGKNGKMPHDLFSNGIALVFYIYMFPKLGLDYKQSCKMAEALLEIKCKLRMSGK